VGHHLSGPGLVPVRDKTPRRGSVTENEPPSPLPPYRISDTAVKMPADSVPDDPSLWRLRAACRKLSPDLFFPGRGEMALLAAAKAVCARCPVREECLISSVQMGARSGVWGGLSERERKRWRRAHPEVKQLVEPILAAVEAGPEGPRTAYQRAYRRRKAAS
jgi:WhiB family transcriptional regulator, redox-sensing transcriptional regulator